MRKPPFVLASLPRLKPPFVVEHRADHPPGLQWVVWSLCEDDLNAYVVETPKGRLVWRSCGFDLLCDCRRTAAGALKHKRGEHADEKTARDHCAVLNEGWELAYAKARIEDGARVRAGDFSTHYLPPSEFVGPIEPWIVLAARQFGIREDDVPF